MVAAVAFGGHQCAPLLTVSQVLHRDLHRWQCAATVCLRFSLLRQDEQRAPEGRIDRIVAGAGPMQTKSPDVHRFSHCCLAVYRR